MTDARPEPDRALVRRQRQLLALLFVLALPILTPTLRGDGIKYYAYVASLVIDGDFQFENEYRRADPAACWIYFDADGTPPERMKSPTGHLINYHAAGPAFFWLPFFVTAHAGVLANNALRGPEHFIEPDGYSRPYKWLCAFGTALLGFLGLLLAHAMALRVASPWAAFVATLAIWAASNFAVYMHLLPFLSHAPSVFLSAAFLLFWWRTHRDADQHPTMRSAAEWLGVGLLLGLSFSTYYIGSLLGLFVLIDGFELLGAWRRRGGALAAHLRHAAIVAIPGFGGIALGMLVHAIPKYVLYGDPLNMGYDGLVWQAHDPFLFEVLFSQHRGLFTWNPVYVGSLAGLGILTRRLPGLAWRSLLVFGVCTWLIASKPNWPGGSAFGQRYLLLLLPVYLVGLAVFLDAARGWLRARLARDTWADAVVLGTLALLAAWNVGLLFQWGTNMIPNRKPVSFREVAVNQVTAVPQRLAGFVVPFLTDRDALVEDIGEKDLAEVDYRDRNYRGDICKP